MLWRGSSYHQVLTPGSNLYRLQNGQRRWGFMSTQVPDNKSLFWNHNSCVSICVLLHVCVVKHVVFYVFLCCLVFLLFLSLLFARTREEGEKEPTLFFFPPPSNFFKLCIYLFNSQPLCLAF